LTLIGRQDILIGDYYDWWLFADGTGRRSGLLPDAVRLTYKGIETKLIDGIHQSAEADAASHARGTELREQPEVPGDRSSADRANEQGVVVYVSNKSVKNTTIDGYFIYKGDDRTRLERRGVAWFRR
jgi:hypothetical protein